MSTDYAYEFVLSAKSPSVSDLFAARIRQQEMPASFNLHNVLSNELQEVFRDAANPNWDGENSAPVSLRTLDAALGMVKSFPVQLNKPEVMVTRRGELGLFWKSSKGAALSVLIDSNRRLTYAAKLETGEERHGFKILFGALPSDLSSALVQIAV